MVQVLQYLLFFKNFSGKLNRTLTERREDKLVEEIR